MRAEAPTLPCIPWKRQSSHTEDPRVFTHHSWIEQDESCHTSCPGTWLHKMHIPKERLYRFCVSV